MLWPAVPAVTAMALVALGATGVTLGRFRGTAVLVPVMLLHLAVYGGLYALAIGATLHAAAVRPEPGIRVLAAIDLAASIGPAAVALERAGRALRAALIRL